MLENCGLREFIEPTCLSSSKPTEMTRNMWTLENREECHQRTGNCRFSRTQRHIRVVLGEGRTRTAEYLSPQQAQVKVYVDMSNWEPGFPSLSCWGNRPEESNQAPGTCLPPRWTLRALLYRQEPPHSCGGPGVSPPGQNSLHVG